MDIDNYGPVPARDFDHVVCPECGSEFQPHITHCIDCGAATVPPGTSRKPKSEGEEEALPLAQDPELTAVTVSSFEWIEELREALEDEGIPSWIEPAGSKRDSFRLYVQRRDSRRARELDREILRERLPDGGEEMAELPPPGICPFCKTALPTGASECPDCGLVLAPAAPPVADNLGIVQGFYAALAAQDQDRVLEILHPEVEWIQNEGFPGGGRHVGAKTVLAEVFARLADDWEGWRADVKDWLDAPADDAVVALGAYSGTCRRTGRSMRAAFAHVYRLGEGRIVRFEQYADTAKVAEAVDGFGTVKQCKTVEMG